MTTPKPGRPNTLIGLMDKRREVSGRIDQALAQARVWSADLEALDGAIRLFDPSAIPDAPKRYATVEPIHTGEVGRLVRIALRDAGKPLTTREIVQAVASARGLDAAQFNALRKLVSAYLRRSQKRGWVTGSTMGRSMVWAPRAVP